MALKILKVYKELRDVVICEDENGNTIIKSMFTDEGTEEERKIVEGLVMTTGFNATITDVIKEE